MAFKPYNGPVLPLDSVPSAPGATTANTPSTFKPYSGPVIPFSEGEDPSLLGYKRYDEEAPPVPTPSTDKAGIPRFEVFGFDPVRATVDAGVGAIKGLGTMANRLPNINPFIDKETKAKIDQSQQSLVEDFYQPKYEAAEDVGRVAGPAIVGGMGGYGIAQKVLPNANFLIKYFGAAIGEALGETAAKERGTDRLLVGENAAIPAIGGLDDKTDIGRLGNDFLDAFILAYGGGVAAETISRGLSIFNNALIKPTTKILKSKWSGEEQGLKTDIARDIFNKLRAAQHAGDQEEYTRIMQDVVKTLRDNERFIFDDPASGKRFSFDRDSMGAIQEGSQKEIDALKAGGDTGSMDMKRKEMLQERAKEVRAGHFFSGNSALMNERISAPGKTLKDDFLLPKEQELGGMEAIQKAEPKVQAQAFKEFDENFEAPVVRTEEEIAKKNKDISGLFKQDEDFQRKLIGLGEKVNLYVDKEKALTVQDITGVITRGYDKMHKELNSFVDKMPEGLAIDTEPATKLLSSPGISNTVKGAFEEAGGDFKTLYTNVVPKITKEIGSKLKAGNGDIADLVELKNFINESGPTEEFRAHYAKEWAPFWKDGKLEDFGYLYEGTQKRGVRPVDFEVGSKPMVEGMIKEPAYADHLARLMAKTGDDTSVIGDAIIDDAISTIQSQINKGTLLKDIDVGTFASTLEKYGGTLERVAPAQKAKLDGFIQSLRDSQGDIKKLEKVLDRSKRVRQQGERKIFEGDYKEFFDGPLIPSKKGYKAFDEVLGKEGNSERIKTMLDKARDAGDNEAIDGFKSAFIRKYRDTVFAPKAELPGGSKEFNSAKFSKMMEGEMELLEYGKEIFKDTPSFIELLKRLSTEADKMQKGFIKNPRINPLPYNKFARDASTGLDRIITMVLGPLSRAGAVSRSIKGTLVQNLDPYEQASLIAERLMASPTELANALEEVIKLDSKKLTPQYRAALQTFLGNMLKTTFTENDINELLSATSGEAVKETKEALKPSENDNGDKKKNGSIQKEIQDEGRRLQRAF